MWKDSYGKCETEEDVMYRTKWKKEFPNYSGDPQMIEKQQKKKLMIKKNQKRKYILTF